MALIICPECKKEVSDKAEVCVHCGYPLAKERSCNNTELDTPSSTYFKVRVIDTHDRKREDEAVVLISLIADLKLPEAAALIEKNYSPIIMAGLSKEDAQKLKGIYEGKGIDVDIEPDTESIQRTFIIESNKYKIGVEAVNYTIPKQDENDFIFCPRCRSKLVDTVSVSTTFSWGEPMNVCQKCGYRWRPGK